MEEVPIPAYEAMATSSRLGRRILEILMAGVSTRNYRKVLPEMAETVGVSKSAVSREFVEASVEALKALGERRFNEVDNRKANDGKSLGWLKEMAGLETTTDPSVPTHISSNSTYNQIVIHPDHTTEYTGTHGVLAFDETMFNDDDAANTALSDHRPVWIVLEVPEEDGD